LVDLGEGMKPEVNVDVLGLRPQALQGLASAFWQAC
jgi:hypothetical protein